jgi:RimJ/RimL family protein N-acetyltransferase
MIETKITRVEIETKRLRLRTFQEGDLEPIHRLWNDAEVMTYIRPGWTPAREDVAAYFEKIKSRWAERGFSHLAITLKEQNDVIGYCGFQYVEDTPAIELIYGMAKPFWGQGLTTEAARACLRFAFENTYLERVIALANRENTGSWRVMEKIGMKYEKMAHYYNQDLVYYSIRRSEFQASSAAYSLRLG